MPIPIYNQNWKNRESHIFSILVVVIVALMPEYKSHYLITRTEKNSNYVTFLEGCMKFGRLEKNV